MSPEYAALLSNEPRLSYFEQPTDQLEAFVASLGLPRLSCIPCTPPEWAELRRCFPNVERQVKLAGGALLAGWIWREWQGISIESEAHALWISPLGKRRDLTPHIGGPRRVVFCPDDRVLAKRGHTASHRLVTSTDPRIIKMERFDEIADRICEKAFAGIGKQMIIPSMKIIEAGMELGLPYDVVMHLFEVRKERYA